MFQILHRFKFTVKNSTPNSKIFSEAQVKLTSLKLRMEQLVQPGQLTQCIKHLNQRTIRAVLKVLISSWILLSTMVSIRNHQGIPLDWQLKPILQDLWQEMDWTILKAVDSDSTIKTGLQLRSPVTTEKKLTPWPPAPWNEVNIRNRDRISHKNQQSIRANITSRFPNYLPQA